MRNRLRRWANAGLHCRQRRRDHLQRPRYLQLSVAHAPLAVRVLAAVVQIERRLGARLGGLSAPFRPVRGALLRDVGIALLRPCARLRRVDDNCVPESQLAKSLPLSSERRTGVQREARPRALAWTCGCGRAGCVTGRAAR